MKTIINSNDTVINFSAAINQMDDAIREALHRQLTPCTNQEFFAEYAQAHKDIYDEQWELDKSNPVW